MPADGLDAEAIPELVGSLVERSVLKRRQGPGGDRFRLLEPLRQFGRERLRDAGEETRFQRRHRDWILGLASMAGANDARQAEALDRIRIERANLWAALDVCLRDPAEASVGAEICRDLWICWVSQGPATDARRVLSALLSMTPAPGRARGTLLWVSALLEAQRGDLASAGRMAAEALEIGRAIGDADIVVWALQGLGVAAYMDRRWDDAVRYGNESLNLADTMAFRFAALSAKVMLVSTHAYSDGSMRRSQRPTMRSP